MAYIELTEKNFSETVDNNDIVIIDFWAQWCGPCLQFAPIFEDVAEQNPDVVFAKVNTDNEQALAGHFQIQSIPTLVVIKEQIVVFAEAGALDERNFNGLVEQVRKLDMDQVRKEMAEQAPQS
jgi:thioredoxin 1